MSRYSKIIIRWVMLILVSVFFTSFKVGAAKFSHEDSLIEVNPDEFVFKEENLLEGITLDDPDKPLGELNSNYQFVLGLIKQKEFLKAKEKIESLILQHPTEAAYYNMKAILEINDKNLSKAEQSFQKAIELDAGNAKAFVGLARLKLSGKQYSQAKKYANKALEVTPYAVNAYKILAYVAMKDKGERGVEKVLLDANNNVRGRIDAEIAVFKLLRKFYAEKQQYKKILQLAENLAGNNDGKSAALLILAEARLLNKDIKGAEKILRQLIYQAPPKEVRYSLLLARVLSNQKGRESEVLGLLDDVAKNSDSALLARTLKISFLIKHKNYQQAFDVAEQVNHLYPERNNGKILKGDIYKAEKKYQQAFDSYLQAYEMTRNTRLLDTILGVLRVQNKQQDAIAFLESELAKNKDFLQVQYRLADAYQNARNYDLSIKHYEALLAKNEDSAIILNNLAEAYSQKKNIKKSLEYAKKAYQKAPDNGLIADTYGYILLKNGNKQDGLKLLEKAAAKAPGYFEIQLHLAEAYVANQNKSKAKKILQLVIDKNGKGKTLAIKMMEQL